MKERKIQRGDKAESCRLDSAVLNRQRYSIFGHKIVNVIISCVEIYEDDNYHLLLV